MRMQILRDSILFAALLSELIIPVRQSTLRLQGVSRTTFPSDDDSAKLRHLSRKLNPAECLRRLHCTGCSPMTRLNCLRRLAYWRDKLPATDDDLRNDARVPRTKREAKLPASFLLRLEASRRDSRSASRRKARRRRRRKRITTDKDSRAASSPQVVLLVVCSLAAITASALLLFYLRRRSRQSSSQQPLLDTFFCSPESRDDNLGEIDRCTCCSSSRGDQSVGSRKKTRKKRKTKKKTASRRYSENEELRNRIACILRDQCCSARCDCCKCDNVQELARDQSKRGKFKFFRKSRDKKSRCGDARCDENKISCLVDLCSNQTRDDKLGLRIKE